MPKATRTKRDKGEHKENKPPRSENGTDIVNESSDTLLPSPTESPIYAKLKSVNEYLAETIELRNPKVIFGRILDQNLAKEHQIYEFGLYNKCVKGTMNLISRTHFILYRSASNNKTLIEDFSRNGTFVNQRRLTVGVKTELPHKSLISIGKPDQFFWCYDEDQPAIYPLALTEKYTISSYVIGTGGFSKRTPTCRRVAIKVLEKHIKVSKSQQQQANSEVAREVRLMCTLNNPFCMGFLDFYEDNFRSYIILEYSAGGDLFYKISAKVDDDGQLTGLDEPLGKYYTCQLLEALKYLDSRMITHRDIKPENIMLQTDEDYTLVKLCDFGLAKCYRKQSVMSTYVGTPAYIAPEVRHNENVPYTSAVDVWSLGVTVFLMLSGYPAFCETYPDMDLEQQVASGRLIFDKRWDTISTQARALIEEMIVVDPKKRITAAKALNHPWFDSDTKEKVDALVIMQRWRGGPPPCSVRTEFPTSSMTESNGRRRKAEEPILVTPTVKEKCRRLPNARRDAAKVPPAR
ncbi:unnamed protein product, partial [Mesorhabditis spiculigera]